MFSRLKVYFTVISAVIVSLGSSAFGCTVKQNQYSYSTTMTAEDLVKFTNFPKGIGDAHQENLVGSCLGTVPGQESVEYPWALDYRNNYPGGCFVYGPFVTMSGPGEIFGTIIFHGPQLVHGMDPSTYAFSIDLTADSGKTKLAHLDFTREQARRIESGNHGYTLRAKSQTPLNDIEVRLCSFSPQAKWLSLSIVATSVTVNYDSPQYSDNSMPCDQ